MLDLAVRRPASSRTSGNAARSSSVTPFPWPSSAAGLALSAKQTAWPRGALDAYEEAMLRLRARGQALDAEHVEERRRLSEDLKDKEALARAGGYRRHRPRGEERPRDDPGIRATSRESPAGDPGRRRRRAHSRGVRDPGEGGEALDFVKRESLTLVPFRPAPDALASWPASRRGSGPEKSPWRQGEIGSITGDEELLERAFENLVRNAIEAAGTAAEHVDRGSPRRRSRGHHDRRRRPRARGRGPGAHPPVRHQRGSLGLGLPLAQKIIHVHEGDLVLAERAPRGLAATIRLPLAGPRR